MEGYLLRFYVHEDHRHRKRLVWEWLLENANDLGIRGGSAFRTIAGFGSHHIMHTTHFFELADALTVQVEFLVTEEETQQLMRLIHEEKIRIFYARTPATFGVVNAGAGEPLHMSQASDPERLRSPKYDPETGQRPLL